MGKRSRKRRKAAARLLAMQTLNNDTNNTIKEEVVPPSIAETHKVYVHKESDILYPDLFLNVYVEGDRYEQAAFAQLFSRSSCTKASKPEEADLVIFTGGEDVSPVLYGETPHPTVFSNAERDEYEIKLYEFCLSRGIPMLGICRGAQFLWVMAGGKLYQHIDHHNESHALWDDKNKKFVQTVSSVHHQSCKKTEGMLPTTILATTSQSSTRWSNDLDCETGDSPDIEAFYCRETCALGIQGHPEYTGYENFSKWSLELIQDVLVYSGDVSVDGGYTRVKKDILSSRLAKWENEFIDPINMN